MPAWSDPMKISRRVALTIDLLVLLALWFITSAWLNKPFLPNPLEVILTFFAEIQGDLLGHTWVSARRVAVSVMVGTLVAAPLALLAAESKTLNKFLSPLIYFLYPAPKIVFLPIIIFFLGLGDPSINFLIGLVVFFQIFVIVSDTAAQVQPETIDSIKSLGASRWAVLRYVYLPVSLPAIVTALKVSVGTAIAVLFIGETIGNNVGLGYYIVVEQWNRFAYDKVYAGILAISLLGLSLFVGLSLFERWLNRWKGNGE